MVTIDCLDTAALAAFWTSACGYVILAPPPDRTGAQMGLQRVPEKKATVAPLDEEVSRLTALGPGLTWKVLVDPEGNEFCVSSSSTSDG